MDPPAPAGFSPEQIASLSAPLDQSKVSILDKQAPPPPRNSRFFYLEGWHVIAEANRIFGFDGWQRQTISCRCVVEKERAIGQNQKTGWGVTYTARVRVTVTAGSLPPLIREGSGAGHGIDVNLGQAHESAMKEAETDAMKRALMTFGNQFGLALYDKQHREVEGDPVSSASRTPAEWPAPPRRPSQPPTRRYQSEERPAYSSDPPNSVLVQRAQAMAEKVGLTNDGIASLVRTLAHHFKLPDTERFSELSTEALSALVDSGINPDRVAFYNGDEQPS